MSGRILIVAQAPTNRIMLRATLTSASYEIVQCDGTTPPPRSVARHHPDLVILDQDVVDTIGSDLSKTLTPLKSLNIPVLLLTETIDRNERLVALQSGAEDILTKPIDRRVLLARIRNILRSRGLDQEFELREKTVADLGFQEPATAFSGPINLVMITPRDLEDKGWVNGITRAIPATPQVYRDDEALEQIARQGQNPDVVILHADLATRAGLTLIAELRSRSETRRAAILATARPQSRAEAIAALDVGANDVVQDDALPEEIALRVRMQADRKRKSDRLRKLQQDSLKLAVTDPLTGLFNRRSGMTHMHRIARLSHEAKNPFAIMVVDVDLFKTINDAYGHLTGDAVIREIAERLQNNLRSVDLIYRYGGEEFLVVLPNTDVASAQVAAERLRRAIEASTIFVSQSKRSISTTVSIGVALGGLPGSDPLSVEQIFEKADLALRQAKTHGRNQVVMDKSAA